LNFSHYCHLLCRACSVVTDLLLREFQVYSIGVSISLSNQPRIDVVIAVRRRISKKAGCVSVAISEEPTTGI